MTEEKQLVVVKENFITKLKSFFKKLFVREKINEASYQVATQEKTESTKNKKEEFIKNIKIEENTELDRLKKLQSLIRSRKIEENDIQDEDKLKLRNLYKEQIANLKKKIEGHKKRIEQMSTNFN